MSDAGTVAAATSAANAAQSAAYAADMAGEIYRNVYAINCRTQDSYRNLATIQGLIEGLIKGSSQALGAMMDKLEKIEAENQVLRQDIMTLKAQMDELVPEPKYIAMTR